MPIFARGEKVEVCSKVPGYVGSYFEATIVRHIHEKREYEVQYENLVTDDFSEKLIETVTEEEVRPMPPNLKRPIAFKRGDMVDAFTNDGWWFGEVVARKYSEEEKEKEYVVYFASSNETLPYPISVLRRHLDWVNGRWEMMIGSTTLFSRPTKEKLLSIRNKGRKQDENLSKKRRLEETFSLLKERRQFSY